MREFLVEFHEKEILIQVPDDLGVRREDRNSDKSQTNKVKPPTYDTIQTIVREYEASEFSMFRFLQNWPESMSKAPASPNRWYVAVIGHSPPEPLLTNVTEAIQTGEPVPLPDEVAAELARRRLNETAKRPYTEIHRTFTGRHKKDKEKRKQQKKSRRQNRRQ